MEALVQNFYELVKTSPAKDAEKLLSFVNDIDIEPYLAEGKDLDLASLLGLNSEHAKTDN